MDTTLEHSLQRILECAVCQEQMKDAVILHCGHAFCRLCLNRNIDCNRNICPLCRAPLTHKERIEKEFTPGLIIKNIADSLSARNKPGPSRQRLMCDKHPQNESKYVCERCQKPVCSECAIADHWHNSISPRPKAIVEMEREMHSMVDQSEKWITEKKNFESSLSRTNCQYDLAVSAMTTTEEQMVLAYQANLRRLSQEKEWLSDTIREKKHSLAEKKSSLQAEQKKITERAKVVSSVQSRIRDALKKRHPVDTINAYCATRSKRFKDSLSHPFPSFSAIETSFSEASTSYFAKSEIPNRRLGEICTGFRPSGDLEAPEEFDDDSDDYSEVDDGNGDEDEENDGNENDGEEVDDGNDDDDIEENGGEDNDDGENDGEEIDDGNANDNERLLRRYRDELMARMEKEIFPPGFKSRFKS